MNIIGGVIHNNTAMWLIEEMWSQGVDLDFLSHCCHCPGKDGYHDECWEAQGAETWIMGFKSCSLDDKDCWFREDGKFEIFAFKLDENAEFSAIIGEINAQIVRSNWIAKSAMCSPCYPGQGDLDTPGEYWSYCLPPDLFDENEDGFDLSLIKRNPHTLEIWDNGGKTADRFTVFFDDCVVTCSEDPGHPQGVWLRSFEGWSIDKNDNKRIEFDKLPWQAKKAIGKELEILELED